MKTIKFLLFLSCNSICFAQASNIEQLQLNFFYPPHGQRTHGNLIRMPDTLYYGESDTLIAGLLYAGLSPLRIDVLLQSNQSHLLSIVYSTKESDNKRFLNSKDWSAPAELKFLDWGTNAKIARIFPTVPYNYFGYLRLIVKSRAKLSARYSITLVGFYMKRR